MTTTSHRQHTPLSSTSCVWGVAFGFCKTEHNTTYLWAFWSLGGTLVELNYF